MGKSLYSARPTRFAGLGYANVKGAGWTLVDLGTDSRIGAWYPTRAELLADVERFATERGLDREGA